MTTPSSLNVRGISQERSVEVEAEEWLFKKDLQLRRLKDEEWRLEEAEKRLANKYGEGELPAQRQIYLFKARGNITPSSVIS